MKLAKIFAVVALTLGATGCVSTATSIKQTEKENVYYVTRVQQGPFHTTGNLNECVAKGKKLECRQIDP